jgi:hypothetical protein
MAIVAKNGTVALSRSTNGSTFTIIPGVVSFDPGAEQTEELDATDYDSTNNTREYVNGFKDGQEGSFTVNFAPADATHQALITDVGGSAIYLRHRYDTRRLTVPVIVKRASTPAEVGGILQMTVSFKQSGPAVWAAHS